MTDVYSGVDWIFTTWINLWNIIIQYWALSVPILICVIANIIYLIRGIYSK